MTIPSHSGGESIDRTRDRLDTFGAPITFTGDLMWLHPVTDDNGVARHVHDTVVIVFFRAGSGSHEVAGRAQPITPGDIVIVPPGALHDLTGAHGLAGWALEFSPTILRRTEPGGASAWWAHPLLHQYVGTEGPATTGSLNVPPHDRARWDHLLIEMDRELTEQRPGWSQAATAHLLLLLVSVERALGEAGAEVHFHADPAVTAALGIVERRFGEAINVAAVASMVAMTPEHLTTLVRRATGRTLGQWLTDRRMSEARRLLASTDLSVDAIGRRSGFADAAHFSRRFRQLHGVPPGAWRAGRRETAGDDAAEPQGAPRGSS